MRRAERKLQLSHNVIGDSAISEEGREDGEETGDLRSIIMGLHVFDPSKMNTESPNEVEMVELNSMVDRVLAMRYDKRFRKDDRKFELGLTDLKNGFDFVEESPASYDPVLDEASYLSWVENFKEASQLSKNMVSDLVNRRNLPDDKHVKLEDARNKIEEKYCW